jgi:hypothetical protein
VTLVPLAGDAKLSATTSPFREPPENLVTVSEFVPCDKLLQDLETNVILEGEANVSKVLGDAEAAESERALTKRIFWGSRANVLSDSPGKPGEFARLVRANQPAHHLACALLVESSVAFGVVFLKGAERRCSLIHLASR